MSDFTIPRGFTTRKTEELTTITYVGYSELNEALDSIEWVIQKIEVIGDITTILYAQGSWDDRSTLNYK